MCRYSYVKVMPNRTRRDSPRKTINKKSALLFSGISLLLTLALVTSGFAVTIADRSGGAIYWGGKYVNIKPSHYGDVIGRRSAVDQMEVTMTNDIMTVKITGPYFFNYIHNIKRTQDAPPGDLYISSKGWKVSGTAPYTKDIFEASEGWDYVVSFENKKVYKLNFSDIRMTSALPYVGKYRAHQAWRGGYGESIDDADVILTDSGLTFTFSVRNMKLESEIGVHWTMKCGNDIIEGSALIPPIALAMADPASAETILPAAPADVLAADPAAPDVPVAAVVPPFAGGAVPAFPAAVGGGGAGLIIPAAAAVFPFVRFGSDDDDSDTPGSGPSGPEIPPVGPVTPTPTSVPEASTFFLLLASVSGILARKYFIR
jgi:hypothetical protein